MDTNPESPPGSEGAETIQSGTQMNLLPSEVLNDHIAKDLRNSIISEEHEYLYDGFLPHSDLERILSDTVVTKILQNAIADESANSEYINGNSIRDMRGEPIRLKILAILLLIDATSHIAKFVENGVKDENLPLTPKPMHEVFEGLRLSKIDSFFQWQWVVLAPVIDFTSKEHEFYQHKTRMPFLPIPKWKDSGAHGEVSKISIHRDHQRWGSSIGRFECYAIKRFYSNNEENFMRERAALEMFSQSQRNHGNLIELLFSYELKGDQFMIFPWADCNLQDFWRDNKSQPDAEDGLSWLLQQCHGLAEGLCEVHWYDIPVPPDEEEKGSELLGRHGDIKPKNILFFGSQSQRGRLVIADFTLMRFHAPNTDNTEAKNIMGFSRTYRPPELGCNGELALSQKYDIWTLGCVFLEFITWHLVGYDAIHKDYFQGADGKEYVSFSKLRLRDDDMRYRYSDDKFFNRDANLRYEPKARVKDSVIHWIGFLKEHPKGSPASRAFLTFILERMMVINADNRCSMNKVRRQLERIMDGCIDDDGETENLLPREFPPLFIESERDSGVGVPNTDASQGTSSESCEDLETFREMDLPLIESSVQAHAREEGHPTPPKTPSVRDLGQDVDGALSENQGRRNSQRSDGSHEEAQKAPNTSHNEVDGVLRRGKNRMIRTLGKVVSRLVPAATIKRLSLLWNKASKIHRRS